MSLPAPRTLLRHRPPALRVDRIAAFEGTTLTCEGDARDWTWDEILEGCAQTAGLLVGMQADGLANDAVIAEYRDVRAAVERWTGAVGFHARLERRHDRFWRCAVDALAPDGAPLLAARVTLAPPGAPA